MTPIDITGTVGSVGGLPTNPFVMLTFIVAPAVLTNACAILAMKYLQPVCPGHRQGTGTNSEIHDRINGIKSKQWVK